MEDITSLWSYQEGIDEMRQRLLCTSLEFEQFKAEANEELRKQNEYVKHLIQLLKNAFKERDEARDQLQILVNKVMPSTKANSSITESNSLSETYNFNSNSHGSSPVESFFDPVSSPEFSNINVTDSTNIAFVNQPIVHDSSAKAVGVVPQVDHRRGVDQASAMIDNLAKGKTLPQKGKLLQAVLDTPPLLQSLLVAGPLPKWRNPPRLQPFQIPPFSIKGNESDILSQKPSANLSHCGSISLNPQTCVQMSCGSSQKISTPMLNFSPSGSRFSTEMITSATPNFNNLLSLTKRQRLI